jgi:uncharacterized coiled-coil protein SlyX
VIIAKTEKVMAKTEAQARELGKKLEDLQELIDHL